MNALKTDAIRGAFLAHAEKLFALKIVGESASLREAASRLGLAPSSLSEKIRVLEKLFGRALVERETGRLRLVPFAEELLAQAGAPLEVLADLAPSQGRDRVPKVLRIGAYDSLAVYVAPHLLAGLARESGFPRLEISTGRSAVLVASVARSQVDLAIVIGLPDDARLDAAAVASEELSLVRPAHVTEARATADLARGSWVGLAAGRTGHARFYRLFCSYAAIASTPTLACDSFEVIASVALASGLPAVLPVRVAERRPRDFRALALPARVTAASRHEIVVVRRRNFVTPVFERLVAELKDALG